MSNDGTLLVNFGSMERASADISRAVSALKHDLAELDSIARPLRDTWEGSAQRAYDQRQAQWSQASADLIEVLQRIKRALDDSTQDYLQTERRNARQFGA
ncbi:MAG TPA: WXG100 family type VII secretion target [Micromonosporaceae bacterium]|nr:WXG100 family type VII secretion target [Micromonosporaceae bacterium]